jgi:hypothetical protein
MALLIRPHLGPAVIKLTAVESLIDPIEYLAKRLPRRGRPNSCEPERKLIDRNYIVATRLITSWSPLLVCGTTRLIQ